MNLRTVLNKSKMWCTQHSAEICTGVAVVASVTAVATAIKATIDIQDEVKYHKESITAIKESYNKEKQTYIHDELVDQETMEIESTKYSGEEAEKLYRKDLTGAYAKASLTMAKYYALPVALEITAVATMIASNKISRKKNASLAASLTAVQAMYDRYRQGVIERYGDEEDRNIRLGLHKEKQTIKSVDENGNKVKTKEEVLVQDKDKVVDPFTGLFAEGNNYWTPSLGMNRDTLELRQSYWNDKFVRDGYVFVNDIWKDLDMEQYCTELGQYYGWVYNEDHPGISFHLFDAFNEAKIRFQEGYEPNIWITLMPDGYIADKVWPKKTA